MYKKVLLAAAVLVASSPAIASAQDIFFSFDSGSRAPTTTLADGTTTGSVFVFADVNFDFNQLDIDFTNDNAGAVAFTGGQTFNGDNDFTTFDLLDPNDPAAGPTATDGRLFATSFLTAGVEAGDTGDGDFVAGADGFLLAQVDFDVVGPGSANFDFILGDLGILNTGVGQVATEFGSASLVVEGPPVVEPTPTPPVVEPTPVPTIPEPSSAILLMLGAVGMVARRKRS